MFKEFLNQGIEDLFYIRINEDIKILHRGFMLQIWVRRESQNSYVVNVTISVLQFTGRYLSENLKFSNPTDNALKYRSKGR